MVEFGPPPAARASASYSEFLKFIHDEVDDSSLPDKKKDAKNDQKNSFWMRLISISQLIVLVSVSMN